MLIALKDKFEVSTDVVVFMLWFQIIDMLILYVEKGSKTYGKNDETECLSNFHNRLQITDTPEKLCNEIDGLRKVLDQMETLSL